MWIKISNLPLTYSPKFSVLVVYRLGLLCEDHPHSWSFFIIPFISRQRPLSCHLVFYTLNSILQYITVISAFLYFLPFHPPLLSAMQLLTGSHSRLPLGSQPPLRKIAAVIWTDPEHQLPVMGASHPARTAEPPYICSLGSQRTTSTQQTLCQSSPLEPFSNSYPWNWA